MDKMGVQRTKTKNELKGKACDEFRYQIERLCQKLEGMEKVNHDVTVEYEEQLSKVQEELARLKRSYEKLLKKQLREARQSSKSQENDHSEVDILTRKLEEFRQKSLDWEKHRLNYQQHVASLEAQRKALAEQSELIQAQLSSQKQMFESVELASKSEIHHLTSKLERANDTICANELEMERLNMKVDDLTDTNKTILEEQQRLVEELKLSRHSLEVLHDEKMELRATLLSQEDFVNSLQIHNEQLQLEVSKLTEMLCSKEALLRSLEQQLQSSEGAKGVYHDGAELKYMHQQLDHADVCHLETSLGSAKAKSIQPDEQLTEKSQKLQLAEEHLNQAKAEIKKLKEQLLHKEQSHNSELEGMKQEVTQLTRELHQRDITIASSSGSTLGLEQQLRTEIEKAERKAVEHRVKNTPLAELQESYLKALNKVESEKQQLQKELAESRAVLEISSQIPQDKYESIVQEMQHQVTEIKNTESRKMQELQCKHEEELRALQARFDKAVQHYEEEIQKLQQLSARVSLSSTATELSPPITRNHSVESSAYGPLLRSDPMPCGNKEFTYDTTSDCENEFLPLIGYADNDMGTVKRLQPVLSESPLPIANLGAIAAKFLEEEEKRSHHILERLDAHIEELKRESEKTVQQFTHQK
ncbi:hypothetical protein JD844_007166 [Phrynosoma platyrhinos]|uniref:Centrosomal protein of 63 kDa n=1 Tax=Phrynosoma platyrhinos TaxID=52577 RepID=A0ABQ7T330_PHRPL|nr:hypothetical protein JD844_007166 [Phrynosoma platyrhinos]